MSDHPGLAHSWLAESEAVLDPKHTLFARAELVRKSAEDLALDAGANPVASDRRFGVGALTLGAIREIGVFSRVTTGVGASGTVNVVPGSLRETYGSRTPLGAMVFVRLRPTFPRPEGMQHMSMPR
jgi:hypothetical protein